MGIFDKNSDKITRQYFDSLLVETRYIGSCTADTTMSLYGETFRTPVMTAALSHLNNTAPDGMTVYAKGAYESGAVHWVGMGSDEELDKIVATNARTIKIVKPMEDEDAIYHELHHAEEIGCMAVGMDVDHSFSSDGGYDNVMGIKMCAKTTDDLKNYISSVKIPFIIKGVLSVQDTRSAIEAGASGIVVSHHHGMIDYAVPPLMVLEDIVKAAEGRFPVFVDCGIESAMDVYKALALGATAVSVGRHLMPFLSDGPDAVADEIKHMDSELRGIMGRTGVKTLADMDSSVIHKTSF